MAYLQSKNDEPNKLNSGNILFFTTLNKIQVRCSLTETSTLKVVPFL